MDAHALFREDENGDETKDQIAWLQPAKQKDVDLVLSRPTDGMDGRSPWMWVRLQDGTLMLATFPQGETYCEVSDGGVCDFQYVKSGIVSDEATDRAITREREANRLFADRGRIGDRGNTIPKSYRGEGKNFID